MRTTILTLITILLSFSLIGQNPQMTLEECKENQLRVKAFLLQNKFTQVEVKQYFKDRDWNTKKTYWKLSGIMRYEYDVNAALISCKLITISIKGEEQLSLQEKFVYNSMGVCDSATMDTGSMGVATSPYTKYIACYYGKKKLKNGLTIKSKSDKGHVSPKIVYTFK